MSTSHSESRSGLVVELAAEIREVFPAMAMMENIALADESLECLGTHQ